MVIYILIISPILYDQQRPSFIINKNVHRKSKNPRLSTSPPRMEDEKNTLRPILIYAPTDEGIEKKNFIRIGRAVTEEFCPKH